MPTSSDTWKSNMPTAAKSAPFSKAYVNPWRGGMAPAARTFYAIHGRFTPDMNPITRCGSLHQ